MAVDPEGVVPFSAGGEAYQLYFGMRAIKAIERDYDLPFLKAVASAMPELSAEDMADRAKVAAASVEIRLTDVARLFGAGLLKHHPEIGEEQVEDIIDEIGLGRASLLLTDGISAALFEGEGDDSSAAGPPKPARKSRTGPRSR